jgi:hypothetical protein
MSLDEAKAFVHSAYPEAYHMGHGTANQIVERHYTSKEREQQRYPELKRLSQCFVIFPRWPREMQDQLDTAMWVQAAAVVLAEKEGRNDYQWLK